MCKIELHEISGISRDSETPILNSPQIVEYLKHHSQLQNQISYRKN